MLKWGSLQLKLIEGGRSGLLLGQGGLDRLLRLRNRHFLMLDLVILSLLPIVALSLRLETLDWWPAKYWSLLLYTLLALLVKTASFYLLGLYCRYWCYAGVNDLARIALAVTLSTLVLMILVIGLHPRLYPYGLAMYRTVPVIDGLLTVLIVGGYRFAVRGLYHWQHRRPRMVSGRRTLVVGAGEAGTLVVREMGANPQLKMEPVAFVDDDPAKIGSQIQSVPVLAACQAIPWLVERHQIQRIVVAMPSAPLGRLQELLKLCRQTGVPTDCLPGIYELLAGSKTISPLPRININRLLQRQPVDVDQAEVAAAVTGKTILVTGAGGSIGRELCRQLARLQPETMILLGHGENSIFEINLDLWLSFPGVTTRPVIVDVRDAPLVNRVIQKYRPNIIFHAAAHKHVPFMEENVKEAVTNNILGTQTVVQAAAQFEVERFVLISTDKAVNPTSIMGATKRIAELLVSATARRSGRTYMAVRFGNVLGSRGSVIPIFQQQIAAGGPVTVTHPEMSRYFMTIPEAVQLVLQASVLGQGGEIFVLDMGRPVRILDLATDLIRLSGYHPGQDIPIVFTGIRPGEKLHEELFLNGEAYRRTRHDKIFVARHESTLEVTAAEQLATELVRLATATAGRAGANERMRTLIPEICFYIDQYQPQARTLPASTEPARRRAIRSALRSQPSTPTV
jgi:FlaA1/EpsC-like NDP-sugar epimerase